jgi:hypothetical protein
MKASLTTAKLALRSALALTIASALPGGLAFSQEHRGHGSPAATTAQPSRQEPTKTRAWTKLPALVPAGRGERGSATLAPLNSNAPEVSVFSPDISKPATVFAISGGKWIIKQPDPNAGGYSLLLAKEESATEIRTASTLWMFPSKPQSPDSMLQMKRSGLLIYPVKLPQFGGFREGKTGEFVIRHDGVPVPGISLSFDTENGSHQTAVADGSGVARISFPHDFDPAVVEKEGGAARTRRSFVLGAELERDGVRHVTGFSNQYLPDLMRERSLLAGTGLLAFGMILATPMLRRKKESSNA